MVDQTDELFTGEPAAKGNILESCCRFFELPAQRAVTSDEKFDFGKLASCRDDTVDIFLGGKATCEADAGDLFRCRAQRLFEEEGLNRGAHHFNRGGADSFDIFL